MRSEKTTSARTTGAISIFVGVLLVVIFGIGLAAVSNPGAFFQNKRYDFAMKQFVDICSEIWLPAGIIGIPTLVISVIRSLVQESRAKE